MPFNGVGQFISLGTPTFPAVPDTVIVSVYYNNTILDLMAGLGQCLTRDGQSSPSANLPMAGFKLTGMGAGATIGQALTYGQSGANFDSLDVTTLNVPTQTAGDSSTLAASTEFVTDVTNLLAPKANPIFSGIPQAPTAAPGTNSFQLATTAFVVAQAFAAALPVQTGQAGKVVTTNGATASWAALSTVAGQSLLGGSDISVLMPEVPVAGTAQTMVSGNFYSFTNVAASIGTLPATPANGATVGFFFTNGLYTNKIARNGQTILDLPEDLDIDDTTFPTFMRFTNSTWRVL